MGIIVRRQYHSRELGSGQLKLVLKSIEHEVAAKTWKEVDISITRNLPDGTYERRDRLDLNDVEGVTDLHSSISILEASFHNDSHSGLTIRIEPAAIFLIPDSFQLEVSSDDDEAAYEVFNVFEQLLTLKRITKQEKDDLTTKFIHPSTVDNKDALVGDTIANDLEEALAETSDIQNILLTNTVQEPRSRTLDLVHSFEKGYLLDDNNLQKIDEILHRRFKGLGEELDVVYEVERSDGLSYKTTEVNSIIAEDNFESHAITSITISEEPTFWKNDKVDLHLQFSTRYGTQLKVTGKDEDHARLLFQELKDQITSRIATVPDVEGRISRIFSILQLFLIIGPLVLYLFALVLVATQPPLPEPSLTEVLESNDIGEKLNYLIMEQRGDFSGSDARVYLYFFGWLTLFGSSFFLEGRVKKWVTGLYPTNVFLIGSEIENFNRIIKRRENWKWVIVVGLLVNVLAGLIVWWSTR